MVATDSASMLVFFFGVVTGLPEAPRASAQETKQNRRRIKELERELRRKDKALAEAAALLVLSRKVAAIFSTDMGELE